MIFIFLVNSWIRLKVIDINFIKIVVIIIK